METVMSKNYTMLALMMVNTIICMDQPKTIQSNPFKKEYFCIDFSDEKEACKRLIQNEAQLLKSIIAQEQQGNYSPIFKEVHNCLVKFIIPRDHYSKSMLNYNIPHCYRSLKDKTKEYIYWIIRKKRA